MLLLIFKAGETFYALDTAQITQIVPCVKLRPYPGAPPYVAGILNFRGKSVVVADISHLITHTPGKKFMSTRIIVTEYAGHGGQKKQLGLMVEGATSVMKKENIDHDESAAKTHGTNNLGRTFRDGDRLVQFVKAEAIIPPELEKIMDV